MTEVVHPADVLDKHVGLIRWWDRSPYSPTVAEVFVDAIASQGGFRSKPSPNEFISIVSDRLNRSETIYVAPHIVNRVWGIAKKYRYDSVVMPQDLPTDRGYMWLQTPVYTLDIRGRMVSIRVVSWSKEPNGILMSFYSDRKDTLDELNLEIGADALQLEPSTPLFHITFWSWGFKLEELNDNVSPEIYDEYKKISAKNSRRVNSPPMTDETITESRKETKILVGFVLGMWDFMGDQLPGRSLPNRQGARRLLRSGYLPSEVKVVDLRTVESVSSPSENPQEVVWSHRWRVREHKRRIVNRRTGEAKIINVRSYVKGPEFLPVMEREQVFKVRR